MRLAPGGPEPVPWSAAWQRVENGLAIGLLVCMTVLPLADMALRPFAGWSLAGSIPLVEHLTLWIAFVGAAMAARVNRLLALATATYLPETWRPALRLFTHAVAVGITAWLCQASLELLEVQRQTGDTVALGIPVWMAMLVMPAGFILIVVRLVRRAAAGWAGRGVVLLGLLLPIALYSFPQLQERGILLPLVLVILAATALGMPLFAAIGGLALACFWSDGVPLAAVPVETYRLSASPMLPAVPLFTLGGYILSEGDASQRVTRLFTAVFGWMPGGPAIVATCVLAFFTPLTGASGVTILSMGGLLLPVLLRAGYPERFSIGLVTASGSIGLLLPPSLPVILYAVTARNASVIDLFIGGLLPGLLLILLVAGWGARRGLLSGKQRTPFRAAEARSAIREAKGELLLPVVVLAGIFSGLTTLVEAAALTVAFALVLEFVAHRKLKLRRDLPRIGVECAVMVGGFMIILGVALGFTNYLIDAEIPMQALALIQQHIESRYLFLLALNIFLLVVGGLMDIYSAIFVVVPLITPIAAAYGIHPVHLGIIFLANLELGYLTPPIGQNLFLASYRFDRPLPVLFRSIVPYCLLLFAGVLLITYVPSLTLALLGD
ncbi:MAG TPA: TRAP transporter large permease subunit [Candidatus Polarisedimenticolia bacterium]|nr:TRAP transporter large permease subunit [Candidatus Polarisedimenticolia bacterium]